MARSALLSESASSSSSSLPTLPSTLGVSVYVAVCEISAVH